MSFTPVPWGPYGSPGQGFNPINGYVTLGSVHNTEPLGQMCGVYHDSVANAEFVCRAVNCHQDLLDACQAALDFLDRRLFEPELLHGGVPLPPLERGPIATQLFAALAKATRPQ